MKQHKRLPLALLLVFALCIQTLSFTSAAAALADPEPVFSASDMTFSSGTDAVALPQSAVTQLSGLSSGTIIVDFTPTAMSTANCLFSLSNSSVTDAYFNLYIDNRGFLGLEVRNHGETRYVNLQGPAEVTRNTRHIMALSADPQEGYKFYFDGDMVFQMPVALYELWEYDYRFMSTVNSADVGYMGATYRNGAFGYPYYGTIETVVLLSHKKADSYIHIDVEFGEGEGKIPVDSIAKRAEAYKPKEKVTYKMIKEYIEAKYGFKVHTAYIAEVKRNLGLPMYDAPNAVEELKQPRKHPTPEKVEAIKDALRYFAVI